MNVIFISTYLDKLNFVSVTYFKANIPQCKINLFTEYGAPILCWTYKMIQQN